MWECRFSREGNYTAAVRRPDAGRAPIAQSNAGHVLSENLCKLVCYAVGLVSSQGTIKVAEKEKPAKSVIPPTAGSSIGAGFKPTLCRHGDFAAQWLLFQKRDQDRFRFKKGRVVFEVFCDIGGMHVDIVWHTRLHEFAGNQNILVVH